MVAARDGASRAQCGRSAEELWRSWCNSSTADRDSAGAGASPADHPTHLFLFVCHIQSKEFFVNAIAAGEARESSLARLPETSAWRVPRRGSDECWTD